MRAKEVLRAGALVENEKDENEWVVDNHSVICLSPYCICGGSLSYPGVKEDYIDSLLLNYYFPLKYDKKE